MIENLGDKNINQIFLDGTFDVVVSNYKQLIVCLGYHENQKKLKPLFFALLQSKSELAYDTLFSQVKNLEINIPAKYITTMVDLLFKKNFIDSLNDNSQIKFKLC